MMHAQQGFRGATDS